MFTEYPEWGVFVYNDQRLRMYQERIDKSADSDAIAKMKEEMVEAAASKASAYAAMAQRYSSE